jgi:hypothetical protein
MPRIAAGTVRQARRIRVSRRSALKRSYRFGLVLGLICAGLLAPITLAGGPSRDPTPPPPGTVISLTNGECPFPVDLLLLTNKGYTLTFVNGAQILTGQVSVRLTNVSTGSSVDLNVSGPGFTSVGGSTLTLSGASLLFLPAGALGSGSAGVLWLTRGPVLIDFGGQFVTATLTAASASVRDICAVLAGPAT